MSTTKAQRTGMKTVAGLESAAQEHSRQTDRNPRGGNSVTIKDLSLSTGTNTILHKLQRQPQGWMLTDRVGAADVDRLSWDSKEIVLNASASVTVNLEVW